MTRFSFPASPPKASIAISCFAWPATRRRATPTCWPATWPAACTPLATACDASWTLASAAGGARPGRSRQPWSCWRASPCRDSVATRARASRHLLPSKLQIEARQTPRRATKRARPRSSRQAPPRAKNEPQRPLPAFHRLPIPSHNNSKRPSREAGLPLPGHKIQTVPSSSARPRTTGHSTLRRAHARRRPGIRRAIRSEQRRWPFWLCWVRERNQMPPSSQRASISSEMRPPRHRIFRPTRTHSKSPRWLPQTREIATAVG